MSKLKLYGVRLIIFLVLFSLVEVVLKYKGNKAGTLYKGIYPVERLNYIPRFKADSAGIISYVKGSKNIPPGYLINEQGFRSAFNFDKKTIDSLKKEENKKVVLLIGDSFTAGCCADPIDQSFADLLLKDGKYILLNLGVSATDLMQYKLLAEKYVELIQPDLVVVAFYLGNDIAYFRRPVMPGVPLRYTIEGLAWLRSIGPPYRMKENAKPYFESPEEAYEFYIDHYTLWGKQVSLFEKIIRPSILFSKIYLGAKEKLARKNWFESLPENQDRKITNTLLQEIRLAGHSNGIPVIFLAIPSLKDIESEIGLADKYATYFSETTYFFPDEKQFTKDDYDNAPSSKHFNNYGHSKFYEFAKTVIDKAL